MKALFCILLIFCSCSTPRPSGKTEAEILYKEANALIKKKHYLLASERLNQIRSKYPYSYYANNAELLSADILFLQENYVEAAAAYIVFRDIHPGHPKAKSLLLKIAESFYKQVPQGYDRDLSNAHEAKKYYSQYLRKFPKGNLRKEARNKINEILDKIRKKERYVADFYFKRKIYDGARYRYLDIVKNFDDKELKNHSILRILEASFYLKEKNNCKRYYKKFKKILAPNYQEKFNQFYKRCLQV